MLSRRLVFLSLPLLTLLVACLSETEYPGDQLLGTFRFDARVDRQRTTCDLKGPDFAHLGDAGVFSFMGTFSRNENSSTGWFTVQGFSRDAGYEGQRVKSQHRASATLPSCGTGCKGTEVDEVLDVVLLSHSQDNFIDGGCSKLLPDGGLPDGGENTQPPAPTPNGYDVQRACGTLVDDFIVDKSCACKTPCTAVYTVEGVRVD